MIVARLAREAEIEAVCIPELLEAARNGNGAPLDLVRRVDLSQNEIALHLNLSRLVAGRDAALRYARPVGGIVLAAGSAAT